MSSFLHSTVPPAFTVIWGGLKLSCLMTIMGFVALTGRASCAPRHTAERNATASGRNNFRTLQPWRCGEWTSRSQHAMVLIELLVPLHLAPVEEQPGFTCYPAI